MRSFSLSQFFIDKPCTISANVTSSKNEIILNITDVSSMCSNKAKSKADDIKRVLENDQADVRTEAFENNTTPPDIFFCRCVQVARGKYEIHITGNLEQAIKEITIRRYISPDKATELYTKLGLDITCIQVKENTFEFR